jgi:hypothetical protein
LVGLDNSDAVRNAIYSAVGRPVNEQNANMETIAPDTKKDALAIQSIAPQSTGVTAPEMPNPVKEQANKMFGQSTFQDLLAAQRQEALKEKTDAVKMQQYHALADAFNAIGKLGGTAVGGAVGGNVADSAPAVDPYKESRGYIQAFEKAKAANDRLKSLDDKMTLLAYEREKIKDARDYESKVRAEERAQKEALLKLDQDWNKEFFLYKANIEKAIAEGNLRLKAQLDAEFAAKQQQYWTDRQSITHRNTTSLYKMQYGDSPKGVPFVFSDGSHKMIPTNFYNAIIDHFIGMQTKSGEYVDEENVLQFMKDNPKLVSDYMVKFGEQAFYKEPIKPDGGSGDEEPAIDPESKWSDHATDGKRRR